MAKGVGIEKDEGYYEIAKARFESFSKEDILKEKQQLKPGYKY